MNLSNLSDALGNSPGMVLATILGLAGMVTLVVITLGSNAIVQWRMHQQYERHHELTRELLARGMSAAEIETVVRAAAQRGTDNGPQRFR